jgi:hypothetical protein
MGSCYVLTPLSKPVKIMKFQTYDLEWIPQTYQLRLVGTYDGLTGTYRHFKSVEDFLTDHVFKTPSGTKFFAHAGGLADVQFIVTEIMSWNDPSIHLTATFSGSSAICVNLTRGKKTWTFLDSYWLLRDSLAKIGKSIGLEKGGTEYRCSAGCNHPAELKCIFFAPYSVLRDYNELDCRILWEAISRFQEELLDMGGELKPTIASCAMTLFRRRFLTREIVTDPKINEIAREAYIASRVEVIRPRCGEANYYDINSSFPYSMTFPQAGSRICIQKRRPENEGAIYLARAKVKVLETFLPPLGYRTGGKIYFPCGTWEGWFTDCDLELLEREGGNILGISECHVFEAFTDLANYAETIYSQRKIETNEFRRLLWKYLLNSLYGKFAEQGEKEKVVVDPTSLHCPHPGRIHDVNGRGECMRMITPRIWSVREERKLVHEHVPVAARITALSRRWLYERMCEGERLGEIYYSDTDSVVTTADLPVSNDLGALKLEKVVSEGLFLAPKFYRIGEEVRSKGFTRLNRDQFDRLVNDPDGGIEISRMARLKEMMNSGEIRPYDKEFVKRLRLDENRPKRCWAGINETRPWTIRELEEA